jgi:hypothetical protein
VFQLLWWIQSKGNPRSQLEGRNVYYESIKRDLKRRPICECRYDQRSKDRDNVNRREFWVYDGWVCDCETIGFPSIFMLIHNSTSLVRVLSTLDLSRVWRKWNSPRSYYARWTPEAAKKRSVFRWDYKNKRRTNSLCNLPDVLVWASIKEIMWEERLL